MIRAHAFTLISIAAACSAAQLSYAEEWAHNSQGWEDAVNTMSNEELVAAAQEQRDDSHCPTQKALNHQWLAEHNGKQEAKVGNKALQFIAKKAFKNYMGEEQQDLQLALIGKQIPQTLYNHSAAKTKKNAEKFSFEKLDYGLKVSGNKLKLAVEYEF